MSIDQNNLELMQLALIEARKRQSFETHPNPRVGAALRSLDGKIVSAFHSKAGAPHAEIEVFQKAKELGISTQNATLAVTLEPCSHHGKTPPCSEAVFKAGVSKVLIGSIDPNPLVSGKGVAFLEANGIEVQKNLLKEECFLLNQEWLLSHTRGRPYVRLKMATSLDGSFASEKGQSKWITGPVARNVGHELREKSHLLISGTGTLLKDDPSFAARYENESLRPRQPKVWILEREKRTQIDLAKFKIHKNLNFEGLKNGENLDAVLRHAHGFHYYELLIEAGPKLSSAFLKEGLVDELHLFMGTQFLGAKTPRVETFTDGLLPGLEFEIKEFKLLDSATASAPFLQK